MDTMSMQPSRSGMLRSSKAQFGMTLVEVSIAIAVMVIGFLAVILAFSQGLQWAGEIAMGHTLGNAVRSAAAHCMVEYPSAEAFRQAAADSPQGGLDYDTAGYAMKIFPGRLVHLQMARGSLDPQEPLEFGGWFTNTGSTNRVQVESIPHEGDVAMGFTETQPHFLPSLLDPPWMVFESGALWEDIGLPAPLQVGELHTLRIVAYRNKTERDTPNNEDKALGIFFVNVFFRQYE